MSEELAKLVASTATDALVGVSIPVRRNALKAFGQLCTAAIEIPAAYIEGVAAEKRAETEARVKLISATMEKIAEQMAVDPAYAQAAIRKYGQRIVGERINLDRTCDVAAKEIEAGKTNPSTEDQTREVSEISDDWLNQFEKEASQKSSEEMQLLFGRILAGEIQRPSSFSIKTIKRVGELNTDVANLFRTLCSLSTSLWEENRVVDARVLALEGHAAANSLKSYGLSFLNLNQLEEYGLIIPDYNSWLNYHFCVADASRDPIAFNHQNRRWVLTLDPGKQLPTAMRLHGVAFSQTGRELMPIVELVNDDEYLEALKEFFKKQDLIMTEV